MANGHSEEKTKHIRHVIRSLEAKALKKRSFSIKFADELTGFFGSVPFLFMNVTIFAVWLLINTNQISSVNAFDPYPFVMLTTVVSLEAIVLTTIVLMSQNRQGLISSLREEVDIQVNLMAEREITKVLKLLNKLLEEKGIKMDDLELSDMLKEIDESYIERKLTQELTEKNPKYTEKITRPFGKTDTPEIIK